MRIADVIFGALAPAAGIRSMSGSNGSCTTALFSGYDPNDPEQYHVYLETIAGGAGAHRDMDGQNGVQVHMTNTSNLPVEALEMEFPLIMVKNMDFARTAAAQVCTVAVLVLSASMRR